MSEMKNTLDKTHRLNIAEENSTECENILESPQRNTLEQSKQPLHHLKKTIKPPNICVLGFLHRMGVKKYN